MLSKNKKLFHTIKTQVTAFIIIGILIIAIVWGALYISEYFSEKEMEKFAPTEQQLTLESNTIKENIDTCVQSLTDKGMQLMSDQGLYLQIPENYTYDENYAYWLKNTINIMPSSFEKIDQELAYYINSNLPNCANLDEFKQNGWDISPFIPFTTAQIHKEDVGIEVKYTINVKKQDFEREFSNSIYNPKIRFRQMYGKSVDFINTQLLRPDFDFNNPLEDYNLTGYTINHEKLDNQTLLFSIKDPQSKVLDGKPFTLKFAADISINNIPRTYDVSDSHETRVLYSPDRLAVLILQPGVVPSSNKITIGQGERENVLRKNTPSEKEGTTITRTKDILFNTEYPIYQFSPTGTTFNEPAILRIYLNKDQREIDDEYTLLYYGKNGWLPYPNLINSSEGSIDTLVHGFSKYTVANCDTMSNQNYEGPKAKAERSFGDAWGTTILQAIIIIIIIIIIIVTLGSAAPIAPGAGVPVGTTVGPGGAAVTLGTKSSLTFVSSTGVPTVLTPTAASISIPAGATVTSVTGTATLASGAASAAPTIGALAALSSSITGLGFGVGSVIGFLSAHYVSSLGLLYGASKLAYNLWNGLPDEKDTFVVTAICDSEMFITPHADDGDCKCYIQEFSSEEPKSVSGAYYVERGQAYTVVAAVTDFDARKQEATCQCEIEGLVVTASSDPVFVDCINDEDCDDSEFCNIDNECEEKPGPELICCITDDGFCLDNYINDSCSGDAIQRTCSELTACAGDPPLTGEGDLQISSEGNPQGFGKEGDIFTISYYLQSASEDTTVIAHIKKDGTEIDSISLHDDGAHNDENANDKYYANTWRSRNVLRNQNSAQITLDIEVRYGNIRTTTNENAGSIMLVNTNTDCESMGPFSFTNSLDIILAGNYYNNLNEFYADADVAAAKILQTSLFTQYYSNQGINFYKLKNLFSTSDLRQIKTYANQKCDYSNANRKLIITQNNDAIRCTQQSNVVELNPLFAFKSEISTVNVNTVLNNFCNYVNELNLMNPPEPEIITENMVTTPGHKDIEFKITDEEYPVDYELLWNHVPLTQSQVQDNSIKTHTLNLPNGEWIVQIKATDQRDSVGYSEVLSIIVSDEMQMDLSSISPLNIPSGGSATLNLNDAVYDPANEPITAWTYSPAFSQCVSFTPTTITNGQVTITHIKDSSCSLTVTFEAIGTNNRRVSDSIEIIAG